MIGSMTSGSTDATLTPVELARHFVGAAVDPAGSGLASLYAAVVELEAPFAPPGVPRRSRVTAEELRAAFGERDAMRRYTKVDGVSIHETADDEVVVVEFVLHGVVRATGHQFELPYICVMTIREGRIVRSRDYTDPVVGARVIGVVPELIADLAASVTGPRSVD